MHQTQQLIVAVQAKLADTSRPKLQNGLFRFEGEPRTVKSDALREFVKAHQAR